MEMLIGGTWQPAASGRAEQVAQLISGEAGKTIAEARGEAGRSGDLIRLAAFEGTQLYGDALPLDANRGTGLDKIGFTIHQPVGIDVSGAVRAIREIDAGTVHINWTPLWRADLMPYGGLKASGIGKEGPRSAVAEMTDTKTVILHGRPW